MATASSNIEAIYPLTPVQTGILFHTQYAPAAALYFQQYTCRLEGDLDFPTFEESWRRVVARHEVLRSMVAWEGREQPLQIVRGVAEIEWTSEDWRDVPPDQRDHRLQAFLDTDRGRGFVLDQAPLMRLAMLRTTDYSYEFAWSHHHIIIDGWSIGLVLDDVFTCYAALVDRREPDLPPAPAYRSYVRWLKSHEPDNAERFWTTQLSGFDSPSSPRVSHGAATGRYAEKHARHAMALSAELTERLVAFGRDNDLTLNTVVRGAWALVLSRYSGMDDVVFGATLAGRPPDLVDSLAMVGLFINSLPVRVEIGSDLSLVDWLHRIQERQLDMERFESTALSDIQRWSHLGGGEQLFETLLVFENVPHSNMPDAGLTVSHVRYHQRSNYPLVLLVTPGERLEWSFLYDVDRFETHVIERMASHLVHVLKSMCESPDRAPSEVSFFPTTELTQIIEGWNPPKPEPSTQCTLHQLIENAARANPHATAVTGSGVTLTYAELERRARAVAQRLHISGVRPGDKVGVCLERSPGMIVGILGVLKAGAAYVPSDPGLPAIRTAFMLEDTSASAVLMSPGKTLIASTLPGVQLDEAGILVGEAEEKNRPAPILVESTPDDLAYVIYTSGSTGRPKGVAVSHRSIVNSTLARTDAYGEGINSFLLLSPVIFDSSLVGIFWTLTQGGTLVLPGIHMEQDVGHLAQLIHDHSVSHTLALPSLYELILEHVEPQLLRSLQQVIVAGEPCPPELVRRHYATLPSARLANEYGPTEATVWCTVNHLEASVARCDADVSPRVSIGRPTAQSLVFILDDRRRPVPVGVTGELSIGGTGLASGYHGRADLTDEHFIEAEIPGHGSTRLYRTGDLGRYMEDGSIDLLGRADEQLKIRGQRVELGEIASVLEEHASVDEAVVVAAKVEDSTLVVAYAVTTASPDELRAYLSERLADVMVPSAIVIVAEIPHGPTGKVDRSSLPEPITQTASATTEHVPPSGDIETRLAAIWCDVLGVDKVGATDNFFALGGDSILSIRIIARAHQGGIHITPKQFFDGPTVAALAMAAQPDAK